MLGDLNPNREIFSLLDKINYKSDRVPPVFPNKEQKKVITFQ